MGKRLYTGFSLSQFIWLAFVRAALAFTLVYFFSKYEENPILLSVLAFACFIFILVIGDDKMVIYKDKITQTDNSFLSLAFGWGDKTYQISDIKLARLKPPPTKSLVDDTAAVILALILPKRSNTSSNLSPVFLDLKNGETVVLYTDLGLDKMNTIVEIINTLTNK